MGLIRALFLVIAFGAALDAYGRDEGAVSVKVLVDQPGAKIDRNTFGQFVNTFDAPSTVAPKPVAVKSTKGKLMLDLAPQSITVVALER